MKFKLPPEVLSSLPDPDPQGVVRAIAGLRISPDGQCELIELNDMPLGGDDKEGKDEKEGDMDVDDYTPPTAESVEKNIYG